MARVLIAYSTCDGHTLEICERLKQVVEQQDHSVDLRVIDTESDIDVSPFDKVVIGASIR